ncbi:MAG: hypothetical protein JSR72_04275 [Proteobacteria bacterium]|nr:hypothetical protein [Pseudomonadota bacterium]
MARPKSPTRSIYTPVRIPEDLHQKLAAAAWQGLGSEIKRRLEESLALDAVHPTTRELLATVLEMAGTIKQDTGTEWFYRPYLRAALAEAIVRWLEEQVPDDIDESAVKNAAPVSSISWIRPGDTAETAGENLLRICKLLHLKDLNEANRKPLGPNLRNSAPGLGQNASGIKRKPRVPNEGTRS